jgi:hypothetical protein
VFPGEGLSIKLISQSFLSIAILSLFCTLCGAQQTPPTNPGQPAAKDASPQAPQSQQPDAKAGTPAQGDKSGTSNDRLFFALPNFLTLENGGHVAPLTAGQKFHVVFRSSFDYVQFPWYGLLSGISQAQNSEPGYGQGWEGYGKRYGSAFADGTIENFMVGAIFPSLLHQDPRFFQSGKGGFFHRAGYAVSRSFITRSDSGHSQFNFSEIIGGMTAASISTFSYHPKSFTTVDYSANGTPTYVFTPSDRTLKNTAKVWVTQLSYDTMTIVIKEFWPDIHRKVSHKSKAEAAPATVVVVK